jgi:hypothetical protein
LFIVADVVRLLPRHWDGQRLLRFLAGLALLALAFAAHAGLTAAAGQVPAPAATTVTTTVDVPAAPASEIAPAADRPADFPAADLSATRIDGHTGPDAGILVEPAGADQRAHGSRGPPRY